MNTMLRKRTGNNNSQNNILVQFNTFAENIKRSGKDPQAILNELVNSGQVTQEQLENAKKMAKQFEWLIK